MNHRITSTLRAIVLLALVALPASGQLTLTTTFASNNGQSGNMFDIVATNPVLIQDFDVNLDSGTHTVEIYVVTAGGGWQGNETTSGAWNMIGSATVSSAGTNLPTNLGVSLGYLIPAGATQGFYLTVNSGTGMNYTNGSSVGSVAASDTNMSILEGCGKSYPFGSTFQPRIWNGTVRYTPGSGLFASFTAAPTVGPSPLNVTFTDTSFSSEPGGVTGWEWDFNNDGTIDSTAQNPSTTYNVPGFYTVALTVTDGVNPASTSTQTNLIEVEPEILVITSSGGGVGDLFMDGPNDPPGTTEGYLLFSAVIANPLGSGPLLGIIPDANTFFVFSLPATVGGLFHYIPNAATFPNVPFILGPGGVSFPAGTTFDAVLVQVVPPTILVSNVARVVY